LSDGKERKEKKRKEKKRKEGTHHKATLLVNMTGLDHLHGAAQKRTQVRVPLG